MSRAAVPLIVLAIVACTVGLVLQLSRSSAASEGSASAFTSVMIVGGLVVGTVGLVLLLRSPRQPS